MNTAQDNCISGILEALKEYDMRKVRIFPHKSLNMKTIASSMALCDFLKFLGVDTEVVVSNPSKVSKSLPETVCDAGDEYFVGVTVDCKRYVDIESPEYKKTYVLLDIYGPAATKGFAVISYREKDVCGSSEILYNHIDAFCKENELEMPLSTSQFLYLALVGGTKRFGNNIRTNTFNVAQSLLNRGVNYKLANEIFEQKNQSVLICQELILKNLKQNYGERIITCFIEKAHIPDEITIEDFKAALDTFRSVKDVMVWVLMLETNDKDYLHVIIQGKETNPFAVKNIAEKNNGMGVHADAECVIPRRDTRKLYQDTRICVRQADAIELKIGYLKDKDISAYQASLMAVEQQDEVEDEIDEIAKLKEETNEKSIA